jgi:hypothetical protein
VSNHLVIEANSRGTLTGADLHPAPVACPAYRASSLRDPRVGPAGDRLDRETQPADPMQATASGEGLFAVREDMAWQLKEKRGEFVKSMNRYVPRDYMTNDIGVEIEQTGIYYKDRAIFFVYRHDDLIFKFAASAKVEGRLPDDDQPISLGPVCEVLIFSHELPRPVSAGEGVEIAETITGFLLEYYRFPTAKTPLPERVVFNEIARKALKLPS